MGEGPEVQTVECHTHHHLPGVRYSFPSEEGVFLRLQFDEFDEELTNYELSPHDSYEIGLTFHSMPEFLCDKGL
jgi:hypothetical protein